ncbi:hypothetical protein N7524_001393, partial [Penicillium chrysogenum]
PPFKYRREELLAYRARGVISSLDYTPGKSNKIANTLSRLLTIEPTPASPLDDLDAIEALYVLD